MNRFRSDKARDRYAEMLRRTLIVLTEDRLRLDDPRQDKLVRLMDWPDAMLYPPRAHRERMQHMAEACSISYTWSLNPDPMPPLMARAFELLDAQIRHLDLAYGLPRELLGAPEKPRGWRLVPNPLDRRLRLRWHH